MNYIIDYLYSIDPSLAAMFSSVLVVPVIYAIWRTIYLVGKKFTPEHNWKQRASIGTGVFIITNIMAIKIVFTRMTEITSVILFSNIFNTILIALALWHGIYQIGNYVKPSPWWFWTACGFFVIVLPLVFLIFIINALSEINFGL